MNILALVAHSDDEVLGCGGTLAKHAENNDNVYIVVVSDGVSSRSEADSTGRNASLVKSCDILGIQLLHQFDFKDNQLDSTPLLTLVKAVEKEIKHIRFDVVYTHSKKDLNIDHRIVHDMALTLFRPQPGETVRAIYAFETLSATHWYETDDVFKPQRFVDIAAYWDKKQEALEAYGPEMRAFPHARSIKAVTALAQFRGCQAGLEKAEAFEVLRMVE